MLQWWPGQVSYKDFLADLLGCSISLVGLLLWERFGAGKLQQQFGKLVDLELSVREFVTRNKPLSGGTSKSAWLNKLRVPESERLLGERP
jgi:hypothetical protein